MNQRGSDVLLVEDDVSIREVVAAMLAEDGYPCRTAVDGLDAWEQMKRGLRPGLVVADLHMPQLSGIELAGRMRADSDLCAIPIVVTSGSAADAGNVDAWLLKPYRIESLLRLVSKYCQEGVEEATRARRAAPTANAECTPALSHLAFELVQERV